MFQFLYGHLEPMYKIGAKPEEEIPRIFKVLGYPFTISKSSMYDIGTPHTWPYLLAALVWLVDLIKVRPFVFDKLVYRFFQATSEVGGGVKKNLTIMLFWYSLIKSEYL